MPTLKITSLQAPELAVFTSLTEAQLRNRLDPEKGIFIAESPKVIHVALDTGYEPLALLCEERHITGDAARIIERANALPRWSAAEGGMPVYTGSREMLAQLTGYTLTRGVLCAMRRPMPRPIAEVVKDARRIVVIDGVVDTTNIGAIFRSAAALGIDAVLLTPNSCDPLNRRSIRVSMGSVFLVPWTFIEVKGKREEVEGFEEVKGKSEEVRGDREEGRFDYQEALRALGFETAAMALTDNSVSIDDPVLRPIPRLAIIMGTEGDGLPDATIAAADHVVRIPMSHNVDSLNVAAAAAVAFWELRARQ